MAVMMIVYPFKGLADEEEIDKSLLGAHMIAQCVPRLSANNEDINMDLQNVQPFVVGLQN